MGFKFNDRFHMLETDTLIGTGWFNKLSGETLYPGKDVTHSIGNLGLVPYCSGNKGTKKDYPQYKFSACDAGAIEKLNYLMHYGDCNNGIYSINDNFLRLKCVYNKISQVVQVILSLILWAF